MQRLPLDSITHVLAFCDAHGLAAATSVCREWESIVATPSMAESHLWAALASHAWHAAHRLHAPLAHVEERDEGEGNDGAEEMNEAEEEAAGDAALAAMHTAPGAAPLAVQLAPWMPRSIGYRELLLFSTQWPTRVDASTPAVFCRHADLHQMLLRPVPAGDAYVRALDRALAKEEARKQKQKLKQAEAAKRRGDNPDAPAASGDSASGSDDDDENGAESAGASSGDESMDSDEEDEVLQAVLQDEEAFTALMRERIGADLRQYVEDHRVQLAAQRRRAMAARAGRQGQRSTTRAAAIDATATATAAAPTAAAAPAPAAAFPADSSASQGEAAPAARPGVKRRAQANGPSPAQTPAELAAIAAAESKDAAAEAASEDQEEGEDEDADDAHANESDADVDAADADADDVDLADEDAEVDADDMDEDMDADAEADVIDEDDEDGEDDEEEMEDYDETTSDSDDSLADEDGGADGAPTERSMMEEAISADMDVEMRVHALFQVGLEAAALPNLADRARSVAQLLQGEEATEIFNLLRHNELRRLELNKRREQRRTQRLLRDATFELGCLTRPVSGDPSNQSEALPPLEQHLVRIAYSGTSTGGDRSVRADAVYPTRIPGHATPFTSLCWVRRERWERAVADAAQEDDTRARIQGEDGKFVKATALLTADSAHAPGQKRKLASSETAASSSPAASPASVSASIARASKRDAEPPKKRKTDAAGAGSSSSSAGLGSLDSDDEAEAEPARVAASSSYSSSSHSDLGAFVPVARLSMLAYFEVLIEKERTHHGSKKSRRGRGRPASAFPHGAEQCVAIGLGSSRFRLHGKQPGWDSNSFGFHSDDGSVFHGSGTASASYCPGGFGVGDVVGAGLDYTTGEIFFTKNGRFLGTAFRAPLLPLSLYPLVGLDAVYDVTLNFGDAFPFAFDVLAYDCSTMMRLHVPQPMSQPTDEQKQSGGEESMTDAGASSSVSGASTSASPRAPVLQLVEAYCAFNKAKWRHLASSTSP